MEVTPADTAGALNGMRRPRPRRPWTVRRQLNLVIAAVAVPLVLLAVAMIAFVLRLERRAAEQHVLQVARTVARRIDQEFASAESALRVLATSAHLRAGEWAAFHQQAAVARTSEEAWILLFDADAQQVVNTRFPRGTPLARRANPERVTEVLATRQASVSDVYLGVLTQQPIVTVDVPVVVDGAPRYVLTQAYFLDHFDRLIRDDRLAESWIVAVVDRAGVTVARSHGDVAGRPASPDLLARARAAAEGGVVRSTREGSRVYQAFTRSERSGWLVTVAVSTSALNAPAVRALLAAGLGALLALGLAAVLAAWASRRITQPLRALAQDAAALEAGAPLAGGGRAAVVEIDRVGRALEEAAAAIGRREAELRGSEARLAAIVRSAADAIIVVDHQRRVALFNPSAERMFGCPALRAVGQRIETFVPAGLDRASGRDRPPPTAPGQDLDGGDGRPAAASPVQLRGRRASGEEFPIEATMAAVPAEAGERLILIVRDVTQRVGAEQAFQRQAERLRIVHDMDRAMLVARSSTDIASGALRRLRRLIGVPRAVLVGLHEEAGEAEWLAVAVGGPTALGAEVRFPLAMLGDLSALRRGEVQRLDVARWPDLPAARRLAEEGIRHYVVIPLIAEGRLIGTVNFGADAPARITDDALDIAREVAAQLAVVLEQSRLREELARYARELEDRVDERTRRLTEINEQLEAFAYSVSHDLRAPLRALEGFGQALLKHYGAVLDARGRDYARRIAAAAARMDRLIRDLLAYSQVTRAGIMLGAVDVDRAVADVLRQLERDIEVSGADVRVAPDLPRVRGSEPLLVQALRNLVANALTFVAPGERPVVRISGDVRDDTARVSVEDSGIGVPEEHRERIFKVFERLHGVEAYPGTGIGLAIARKAVERMGGRIGVEAGAARGSRFWIELPAEDGRAR